MDTLKRNTYATKMLNLIVVVTLLTTIEAWPAKLQKEIRKKRATAVVGGEPEPISRAPYLIQIHFRNGFQEEDRCGAAAISKRWALTAAHCIKNTEKSTRYLEWDKTFWEAWNDNPKVPVDCTKDCYIHPDYNETIYDNDVALIFVRGKKVFPKRMIIGMTNVSPSVGDTLLVGGWGRGPIGSMFHQLHMVYLPYVDREKCNEAYEGAVTDHMFCLGFDEGGKDACNGDSGGPAVAHDNNGRLRVYGVVSWGSVCALPGFYGVYADVASERKWLDTTMASR